jgi:Rrf2 family transcriptional regulator, cysteine metabolism repressor
MKVGSRGDYGLRALVYLASVADRKEPVQIHAIAERQQIPEDYLRQLLVHLRLAGLVKSVRGPHGGYLLAKPPTAISMGEVIEVLEGPPERMHCSHLNEGAPRCKLLAGCNVRARWGEATSKMSELLAQTTLAELAREGPVG